MKPVRSHSFNGKIYKIDHVTEIAGIFDEEGKTLTILRGNDITSLGSVLEEGLHAMKIPDRYLHKPLSKTKIGKSASKVDDLARLLWREGWRKK